MGVTNFTSVDTAEGYKVNGAEVIDENGNFVGGINAPAGSIGTPELADGAVTPAKSAQKESVTATADGLTTGLVSETARYLVVTSDANSKIVTLPTSVVGKEIAGYVGANGFRLQTAASSNITINGIDSDGTSYFSVSANTYFVARCVSATAWLVYTMNTTGGFPASNIANSAVSASKVVESQNVTATADGTGNGSISAPVAMRKFVTVTSANATDQASLPGINGSMLGQEIFITVGANGYELITPASSNATINRVDADGTNQMDVAADTVVRVTCVSATGWIAETIAATTIAITAPDND